jgi:hypothetical protein
MTPDAVGGCPPAIPAGEPMIISQPLNSPATTDRLLFRDIVSEPFPLRMTGHYRHGRRSRSLPIPGPPEQLLGSHAQHEDRAVDFTVWVQLAERVTLQQTTATKGRYHGV